MDNLLKLFDKIAILRMAAGLLPRTFWDSSGRARKTCSETVQDGVQQWRYIPRPAFFGSLTSRISAVDEDYCDLIRLIRSLQRLEGNPECFGTAGNSCEHTLCAWREYCLQPESGTVLGREGDSEKSHD